MELTFEHEAKIADGTEAVAVHFPDLNVQVFYLTTEKLLYSKDGILDDAYDWTALTLDNNVRVAPDSDLYFPSLRMISREGIYGCWKSGTKHRLAIYLFEYKLDEYVEDGDISMDINNPIAGSSLRVNNPAYLFANEKAGSILAPGSKIVYQFESGNSEIFDLGQHYCDSSKFSILGGMISSTARNTIGKTLKDQSFDEDNAYSLQNLKTVLEDILIKAGINKYSGFDIEASSLEMGMDFDPNVTLLDGINELLKSTQDWKITELADGIIIIGSEGYSGHYQSNEYIFYRDEDIFSRDISRDDAESFTRVCVYTPKFTDKYYAEVGNYSSWRIGIKKTLYIEMAEGTTLADLTAYANRLATRLSNAGQIESFSGPFRPQLIPGDTAKIIDSKNETYNLGVITSVKHAFGKSGFYTDITVDSGGIICREKITDYVKKLQKVNSLKYRKYE